jgi:hypothetical protein
MKAWRFAVATAVLLTTTNVVSAETASWLYKHGTTPIRRQTDYDDCRAKALMKVPRAIVQGRSSQYCYTVGTSVFCSPMGGNAVDLNKDMRQREYGHCMEAKGYRALERRVCVTQQEIQRAKQQLQKLPSADQIPCVYGQTVNP